MPDIMSDIEAAESEWGEAAPAIKQEMPETGMAVKAEKVFEEQILPISAIEKRRKELGVENASLATREQRDSLSSVNGLCRKVNGQIERVRKFLVEDAVRVQKVVNGLAKKTKEEVALIQKPITDRFAEWKAEDEAAEQAAIQAQRDKEEAERKAAQAIEDAKRAAEAEANRKEAERLKAERAILDAERRKADQAAQIERARIAADAAETARVLAESVAESQRKIDAERQKIAAAQRAERDKFEAEKREFEAKKAAAEKIERDRLAKIATDEAAKAKAEADRIAAEEAEKQRIALEAAEAFQAQQATEKERLRLEALEPDLPKLRRMAAAINLTEATAPEVSSPDAKEMLQWAREHLKRIAITLLDFGKPKEN